MRVVLFVWVALAAVAAAACGGGDGGTQPPQVASVVITAPSVPPSVSTCGTVNFAAEARNAQGSVISAVEIAWTTSDAATVLLANEKGTSNTATGASAGASTIRATANNGAVQSTGVPVTVTAAAASASAEVTATGTNLFSPRCVTITAGGTVTWTFVPSPPHNVKFQGSPRPAGGDIETTQNTTVSRTFAAAGTYNYLCDLHQGMTGVVVVQ